MKSIIGAAVLVLLLCGRPVFADEFSAVRCGADIPKALVGQKTTNEKVVDIERRHKDIGLKDLGGDEISDTLFEISWLICGSEYVVLEEKHSIVHDAMPFPHHSKSSPGYVGQCKIDGKGVPDIIVAVLTNKDGVNDLPATAAWKIDQKKMKYVKISTEHLVCPRERIFTRDGGI